MLKGKNVILRPVRESDLPFLVERNAEFEHRGEWYPHHYYSEPTVRKDFEKDGFWSDAHGMLFMTDPESGDILGEIHHFKTVPYMSELEIAYRTYEPSARRKGITSESVRILTRYLFETMPVHRIRLCIATENVASRGVAEKAGYTHEGTQRSAWFNNGRVYDMELYAITIGEVLG